MVYPKQARCHRHRTKPPETMDLFYAHLSVFQMIIIILIIIIFTHIPKIFPNKSCIYLKNEKKSIASAKPDFFF